MVAGASITVLLERSDRQLDAYGGDAPLRHEGVRTRCRRHPRTRARPSHHQEP